MAAQLKLVLTEDFYADSTSVDLLDFGNGFGLAQDGYRPGVIDAHADLFSTVNDVLTLRLQGSSFDNIAALQQALTDKALEARQYWNNDSDVRGVFVRVQGDAETNARQALVRTIRHSMRNDPFGPTVRNMLKAPEYPVGIERVGPWEATSYVNYNTPSFSSDAVGAIVNYTTYSGSPGALPGDFPGRIAQLRVTASTNDDLHYAWVGFRSDRFGDRTKFQPVWNIRKAVTFGTDTTGGTSNADATALDGYKAVCTFATDATLVNRMRMLLSNATANTSDQNGTFHVLLRAKLSSAGVVRVRLADGYQSNRSQVRSRVIVDKTEWFNYEVGTVQFPNVGRLSSYAPGYSFLAIDAERISGSGSLEMDLLILTPMDEGFVAVQTDADSATGATPVYFDAEQRASGKISGSKNKIGSFFANTKISGGVPPGHGIAVVTLQNESKCALYDLIDFAALVYPRYQMLRGAG